MLPAFLIGLFAAAAQTLLLRRFLPDAAQPFHILPVLATGPLVFAVCGLLLRPILIRLAANGKPAETRHLPVAARLAAGWCGASLIFSLVHGLTPLLPPPNPSAPIWPPDAPAVSDRPAETAVLAASQKPFATNILVVGTLPPETLAAIRRLRPAWPITISAVDMPPQKHPTSIPLPPPFLVDIPTNCHDLLLVSLPSPAPEQPLLQTRAVLEAIRERGTRDSIVLYRLPVPTDRLQTLWTTAQTDLLQQVWPDAGRHLAGGWWLASPLRTGSRTPEQAARLLAMIHDNPFHEIDLAALQADALPTRADDPIPKPDIAVLPVSDTPAGEQAWRRTAWLAELEQRPGMRRAAHLIADLGEVGAMRPLLLLAILWLAATACGGRPANLPRRLTLAGQAAGAGLAMACLLMLFADTGNADAPAYQRTACPAWGAVGLLAGLGIAASWRPGTVTLCLLQTLCVGSFILPTLFSDTPILPAELLPPLALFTGFAAGWLWPVAEARFQQEQTSFAPDSAITPACLGMLCLLPVALLLLLALGPTATLLLLLAFAVGFQLLSLGRDAPFCVIAGALFGCLILLHHLAAT